MRRASVYALVLVGATVGLAALVSAPLVADTAAATESSLRIDGGTVDANVTFELTSDERLNYWEVGVELPDGATVDRIEDSLGEVRGYEVRDGVLEFRTNTGAGRRSETVTVEYTVGNGTVERYAGGDLRVVEVGFVGFDGGTVDGRTRATVTAEGTVFSASPEAGFEREVDEDAATYVGDGAATVRVAIGDDDSVGEHRNYAVFGDANLSVADETYGVVPAAFGFEAEVHRHPVVVLGDRRYNRTAEAWSRAQYRSGGVILLRRSATGDADVLLHETAHAYNAEALAWGEATVGWFEEGTAGYVEFLADRKRGETRRALFAGDRIRDGERVSPRGSLDRLVSYYRGDGFMGAWNPAEADEDRRRFGYAFSELALRAYVKENGAEALHGTYDALLRQDAAAQTHERATRVVLNAMGDGDVLRPCAAPARAEVVGCLREVNTMDATVPAYGGEGRETYAFDPSIAADDGERGTSNGTEGDGGAGVGSNEGQESGEATDEGREGGGEGDGDDGGILSSLADLLSRLVEAVRGFFAS